MKPTLLHLSAAHLETGGVERFLLNLASALNDEYRFVIASPAKSSFNEHFQRAGGETRPWQVRGAFDRQALRDLSALLRTTKPNLIHIHDPRAGLLARPLTARLGIPTIITSHLPPYYYRWARFQAPRQALYGRLESLLNYFFTSAVVYPSQSGYDFAINNGYAPKNKAICIPNGIEVQRFTQVTDAQAARIRQEAGIQPEMPVTCTVARLAMEKNVGLVLEAVGQLRGQGLDFRFWVVGDGPQREMLAARAQANGLGNIIHFWGNRSDIPQLLAASDIFALASWYEGGRTQAVMEAQAAGLPCVLSDVGDHAVMTTDCGLTFPEGNTTACAAALKILLENPAKRAQMAKSTREKALTEYSLAKMTGEYDRLYQKLSANLREFTLIKPDSD